MLCWSVHVKDANLETLHHVIYERLLVVAVIALAWTKSAKMIATKMILAQ